MARPTAPIPPRAECQPRTTLLEHQHRRLGTLLSAVHGRNRFYTRKLDDAGVQLDTLRLPDDLHERHSSPVDVQQGVALSPWGMVVRHLRHVLFQVDPGDCRLSRLAGHLDVQVATLGDGLVELGTNF